MVGISQKEWASWLVQGPWISRPMMRYWSLPPAVTTAVGFGIFKAWHLGEDEQLLVVFGAFCRGVLPCFTPKKQPSRHG